MKTNISRRALATGLALAPVVGLPALAGESGPAVANLWDDWRAFIADYLDAAAKRDAAEKAMPFWAQPGPGNLYSDGSYRGEIIYAPLDITIPPPDRPGDLSISRLVRRTLADCRRDLEFRTKIFGDGAAAKKTYRARLRQLARVRMAQRAEMRKVGLPELDQAQDLAVNRMSDAATAILECPSCRADAIAAKIIVAIWFDTVSSQFEHITIGYYLVHALKALQPQLTGRIRADVGFLINRTDEDEEA
jgi:hypothetical protein